jgi:glycosyltransferase involved in cell wall biosynthesis
MRVGLVTTGFPRFEGDHSGAFLLALARGIVGGGNEVRVLAPEPDAYRPQPHWPGIDVQWIPYARPQTLQRTFYHAGAPDNLRLHPLRWAGAASFSAALWVAAERRLDDCDALVSSWCLPCGWVASEVARGRDHLCICHATDVRWLSATPCGGMLARRIAAGASAFWFLSAAHRDRFLATAGLDPSETTSHIGPMPVDAPTSLDSSRAELRRDLGLSRFTLLFLGRLVPVKGVDQLLHAAARLSEPLEIRVAGDGPERERLEALAQSLALDVTFEGWVEGSRKEALLRACDALVVPSRQNDGLPTVLFEAHRRALPIVATRVGAIGDALEPLRGVSLVPPDDLGALGRAIDALRASLAPSPSGDDSRTACRTRRG